ncbi:hypothetical protein [Wenjunlia tyrosinilytica]|uniref:Uncharacterized protein n=1 Tax=Wenjunlia tyrosinilytica TaxID=1544741 RepID=A0A918A0X1_9ACTN|nr:hypothetical protein [Wenjunlia tyrosinilytica]GGP01347.1 hypothetical protein GCM10012280_72000 [Wenjunlia tyrosinilytica]
MSCEHRAAGVLARPAGIHRCPRPSRAPRLRLALTAGAALTVLGSGAAFADGAEGLARESLATQGVAVQEPTAEQLQAAADQLAVEGFKAAREAFR